MVLWRWGVAGLLALLSCSTTNAGRSTAGSNDPMDLLSSVSGTYTHFVDDDLSVTVSYDLQDDSSIPFSYLTG
ncbi:unnamed protein product [Ectocarpus sp. CCAP 1310/34]|nr:unnamed protein product [Ectocarpus sp. CCAP 1310/34]